MNLLQLAGLLIIMTVINLVGVYYFTQPAIYPNKQTTNPIVSNASKEQNIETFKQTNDQCISDNPATSTQSVNLDPLKQLFVKELTKLQQQLAQLELNNNISQQPALTASPALNALPDNIDQQQNQEYYQQASSFVNNKITSGQLSLQDQGNIRDQYRYLTLEQIMEIEFRISEAFQQKLIDIE